MLTSDLQYQLLVCSSTKKMSKHHVFAGALAATVLVGCAADAAAECPLVAEGRVDGGGRELRLVGGLGVGEGREQSLRRRVQRPGLSEVTNSVCICSIIKWFLLTNMKYEVRF